MSVLVVPRAADAELGSFGAFRRGDGVGLLAGGMWMPVLTALDAWAAYRDELLLHRRRRPATISAYRYALFDLWHFMQPTPWHRLTPELLEAYLDRACHPQSPRPGAPLSAASRAWFGAVVARFYRFAAARGLLRRDPLAAWSAEPRPTSLPRGLRLDELARLLEDAGRDPDPRVHVAVALAYFAMLRSGEIARLAVPDVDLAATPPVLIVSGKGGYTDPEPVHPALAEILGGWLAGLPDRGPVLPNRLQPTRHLHPATVSRLLSQRMHASGINDSGHALRHSGAYLLLLELEGHAWPVSRLLRHRSITSTEIYVRRADAQLYAYLCRLPDPRQPRPREVR